LVLVGLGVAVAVAVSVGIITSPGQKPPASDEVPFA